MRTFLAILSLLVTGSCFSQSAKLSYEDAIKSIDSGAWESYGECKNDSCDLLGDDIRGGDSVLFRVSESNKSFLERIGQYTTKQKSSYIGSLPWSTVIDPITGEEALKLRMDAIFDFFIIDSAISDNSFTAVTVGNDGHYPGTIRFLSEDKFVITRQYSYIDNRWFRQRLYFRRIKR